MHLHVESVGLSSHWPCSCDVLFLEISNKITVLHFKTKKIYIMFYILLYIPLIFDSGTAEKTLSLFRCFNKSVVLQINYDEICHHHLAM